MKRIFFPTLQAVSAVLFCLAIFAAGGTTASAAGDGKGRFTCGEDETANFEKTENMKKITVRKVEFSSSKPSIGEVRQMFDREAIDFNPVDVVNWESYPYRPQVSFRIAHSEDEIYLQFTVKEEGARGTYDYDGVPARPYTDDCVEFFMIPSDADSIYYNLETNCIGHLTLGAGKDRSSRTRFDGSHLAQIRRESTLGDKAIGQIEGPVEWTLTMAIPKAVYSLAPVPSFSGRMVRANFYKCGDMTAQPHFLSWNPIPIEKPDFHRPDHFGELYFE